MTKAFATAELLPLPTDEADVAASSESELDQFLDLVKRRRAVRAFRDTPLPSGCLEQLLDAARWAPSGFNLQPTHFVVAQGAAVKSELKVACLGQRQLEQAPAVIVFTGDHEVANENFEDTAAADLAAGATSDGYQPFLRKFVRDNFDSGRLGWRAAYQRVAEPIARRRRPTARAAMTDRRVWLTRQVMLTTMNFMLAATAAGLATCPMEGFDESRVKAILRIPRHHLVVLVVPVGYAQSDDKKVSTRLPLERTVHYDRW